MPSNYPFEAHLTVGPLSPWKEWDFIQICEELEAKPIFIELQRGQHWQQPMATKVLQAKDTAEAIIKCLPIAMRLNAKGYKVLRTKLECPAQLAGSVFPAAGFDGYFEWHGRIRLEQSVKLLEICARHGAHLSQNALRHDPDHRFVTLRTYLTQQDFQDKLAQLKAELLSAGFIFQKERAEYCVHDSNFRLDEGWLEAQD